MPPKLSQTTRIARLKTPVESDNLSLVRFEAHEGLSINFEYRIDAVSPNENIDFDKSIGRPCTVTMTTYQGQERFFNGILVEAQWSGVEQNQFAYRLVLRPWLWLLRHRGDCRIFKRKNVIAIIREVFDSAGFNDYTIRASDGDYPEMEYTVQYRETDLNFVSRLMEEFGSLHVLRAFQQQAPVDPGRFEVVPPPRPAAGRQRALSSLDRPGPPRPGAPASLDGGAHLPDGKVALNDYDYMKPTANLKADHSASERYNRSSLEMYDYPGATPSRTAASASPGSAWTGAEQAVDHRKHALGDAVTLYPGGLVSLTRHPTDGGEYLVVRARHTFTAEAYTSGSGGGPGEIYSGAYELLGSAYPFRAPQETPRPRIHGPQTGIVVARDTHRGEEIDVDEEGRIFVQFHWNRDKSKISRPVRVAQLWAGKTWGGQFIPRVGQEVVVEFLEGDPDQPLVVGTVYNKDYRYPYALPDNKTLSGIKSDSSKGHGGYNELVFEDKKSQEVVRMRAEKDHDSLIRHAETRVIGETFETPVGSPSRTTTLKKGDDNLKVASGDWNVDIASKIHVKAGQQIVFEVGSSKITMTPTSIKIESGEIELDGLFAITQKAAIIKIN